MKRIYLFLVCAFVSSLTFASIQDDLWDEAASYYSAKQYEAASETYQKLLEYGASAPLYYNYAGALYKNGEIGRAILFYERALVLDPYNEDIKANLAFVNRQKTDHIDIIPQFFFSQWLSALGKLFTSNVWAYISIAFFSLALAMALLYLFSRIRGIRKAAFFIAVFCAAVSITAFIYAFSVKHGASSHSSAIVMAGSVSVTSAPDESGTEVFVIHEGTKVFVRSTLSDWIEVELEDGRIGWLLSSTIERI